MDDSTFESSCSVVFVFELEENSEEGSDMIDPGKPLLDWSSFTVLSFMENHVMEDVSFMC
jgi:hypothetical protein